jgi:hypothetical protein
MPSRKHEGRSAAAEGARRATEAAAERGRWTSARKTEVVLRILRGEDLESLSRELGLTAARLAAWREEFLAAGQSGLKSRAADHRDEEIRRLKTKIGDLTMDLELADMVIERYESVTGMKPPFADRRSKR